MIIYILSFLLSTLLLWVGEKKRGLMKPMTVLALLLPILVAGLRKIGIGTDTAVYVNILYDAAKESKSFIDYLGKSVLFNFRSKRITEWEIGYNFLVYLSTKITGSYQGILFTTHILILTLIYNGLKRLEGSSSRSFAMFIFYFFFYGSSLNAMRQWIAIAVLFNGTYYLLHNQGKKYLLTVAFAMLFHNSAVLGIIVWFINEYLARKSRVRMIGFNGKHVDEDAWKLIVLALVGVIALLSLRLIGQLLGMINATFARYAKVYINGTIRLMPMQIVRRLPIIFLMLINWKKLKIIFQRTTFLYSMMIIDVLTSQMASITSQSSRIGYFFSVYEILLLSDLCRVHKGTTKVLHYFFVGLYCIIVFFYDNVLMGRSEIVPYAFFFN